MSQMRGNLLVGVSAIFSTCTMNNSFAKQKKKPLAT